MIDVKLNMEINKRLRSEYQIATAAFLSEWTKAFTEDNPPCRINEFGIIDENRYDANNGVLFICKETNGWSNEDYESDCLFRGWMEDISRNGLEGRGHIKKHPNMWYNIGRWATLIENPAIPLSKIAAMKASAILAIGNIAFTNINKVRGKKTSGKEYDQLAHSQIAGELLKKEIEIIKPKTIVCCGTCRPVLKLIPDYTGRIILMPHTGARKGTMQMLADLHRQLVQDGGTQDA